MKKLISAFILGQMVLPLAFASSSGTFTAAIPNMPGTLDPASMYDRSSVMLGSVVYEPLLATDGDFGEFIPALSAATPSAENGLISADGLTYTFPIRKGVRFHDGSELNAGDVRYSLMRLMLQEPEIGPGQIFLQPILGIDLTRGADGTCLVDFAKLEKAVRVEGENLVITLQKPFRPFLSVMASWPFVTSRKWAVAGGEWDGSADTWEKYNSRPSRDSFLRTTANGTGPYMLKAFDAEKSRITYVRNPDYWGKPGTLQTVIFEAVPSEDRRLSMLAEGDADYADLSRAARNEAAAIKDISLIDSIPDYTTGKMVVFSFHVKEGNPALGSGKLDGKGVPADLFSNSDVRKGFAYSVDYEDYYEDALQKKARRIFGPVPFLQGNKPGFSYSPELAVKYFKKAFGGKLWEAGFETEIAYNQADDGARTLAEYMARYLIRINPRFVLKAKPIHPHNLLKALNEKPPVYVTNYNPAYADWHAFAFNLMDSRGLFPKLQGYSNPAADALVDAGIAAPTKEARTAIYLKLQSIYNEDVPQVLLYAADSFRAFRPGIAGMTVKRNFAGMQNFLDLKEITKQ